MGYNIIADGKGAFIYSNTDNQARLEKVKHPHYFSEQAHRNLANWIIDRATSRYGKPSLEEWEEVRDEVWEEVRKEHVEA